MAGMGAEHVVVLGAAPEGRVPLDNGATSGIRVACGPQSSWQYSKSHVC